MKILLIGPQGSGKSTQGKLLSQDLKIPYISTGDIFREKSLQDSEGGRKIKQILEVGQLVDDVTTRKLVEERLRKPDVKNGYILDGYPRTSEQTQLFDSIDFKFDLVINFDLPDEIAIERLMKRGRSDDTPEIIKTRIELYKLKTEALLNALRGYGVVKNISAEGSIDDVYKRLRETINDK